MSSGFSDGKVSVKQNYCSAVLAAGGTPMVLPLVRSAEEAENLLSSLNCLIMSGGEDINPSYYGENVRNETVKINSVRDTSDFLLLAAAEKLKLPILGICRGEQIVNVFYGGSLVQDIQSQIESGIRHRQEEPATVPTHKVALIEGTLLHSLLGTDSICVNSFHHQAVCRLAPRFRIAAQSADGVIEAFESKDPGRLILCVQFHPEAFVAAGDAVFIPLFRHFISITQL